MGNEEDKDKDRDFEMYKLLIGARNFHYDNFNKWASYFYVAIGALFVGFYTMNPPTPQEISDGETDYRPFILVLGFIVSLLWYWSCKGYYYWNINWITLVNNYEENVLNLKDVQKRVYYVFANRDTENDYGSPVNGANISTSKIVILFAYLVTLIWGIMLIEHLFPYKGFIPQWLRFIAGGLISITGVWQLSVLLPKFNRSKYFKKYSLVSKNNHFPDLGITQKDPES